MVRQRRQQRSTGRDRRGERDPEAEEQQAEERQHRRDVADEREVEERALLGHRVQRRGGERHCHSPLVERLVVLDPRLVARVPGVARAQLSRERPLEHLVDGVVLAAQLEHARLVVERVGRPLDGVVEGRPDGEAGQRGQCGRDDPDRCRA